MLRPAPSFTSSGRGAAKSTETRGDTHATRAVAATLRALGVRPSRRMGQNFLTDPRVAARIAAVALAGPGSFLEIGPGLGALSEHLGATGRPFAAVELDLRLAEHVEALLRRYPHAHLVRGDILDQRLDDLLPGAGPVTVVANLPYAITSPAIAWILSQGERVKRAVLMTQREVARRLAAKPGTKDYGSFSVFVALQAELEVSFRVSPGAFHPRPDVDSVVFVLKPRPYPGTTAAERAGVERLVRAATGGRRKTMANALANGLGIAPVSARQLLQAAAIDPGRRAETLSVDDWLRLARAEAGIS